LRHKTHNLIQNEGIMKKEATIDERILARQYISLTTEANCDMERIIRKVQDQAFQVGIESNQRDLAEVVGLLEDVFNGNGDMVAIRDVLIKHNQIKEAA
jgi:hypothetical protein